MTPTHQRSEADIIEASAEAYINAVNAILTRREREAKLAHA